MFELMHKINYYFTIFSDFVIKLELGSKIENLKNFFLFSSDRFYLYAMVTIIIYFVLKYIVVKRIYKADRKKRKSTNFNLMIIASTIVFGSLLEVNGFHNKWLLYVFGGISAILVAYNIGTWGVFKKLSTIIEVKPIVKDEKLIDSLIKHITSNSIEESVDFKYSNKKYYYRKKGDDYTFREYGILTQTNKTTRLYDMFIILGLFFVGLLYFSIIFNSFIDKDSMAYGVLLLFGAAFILPYLQDVKNTIRFANNKYLAYGAFMLINKDGKTLFGEIIDMNLYEVILFNHWTKEKIIVSHSDMKTFSMCDEGRFIEYEFVVSMPDQQTLKTSLLKWIAEFQKFDDFADVSVKRFMPNFGYGIRLRFKVTEDNLKEYGSIEADFTDFLVSLFEKHSIDHRTPILETSIQENPKEGSKNKFSQSFENYVSVKK